MQQTSVHENDILYKRKNILGGNCMFNEMKKRVNNQKGLTLIELLAVIVILGIVAAIAIPSIGGVIDNSRYKAAKSDAIMVLQASNLYFTEYPNATTVDLATLEGDGYVDNVGSFKDTTDYGTSVVITKATGGNSLDGTATLKDGKTVVFSSATVDIINKDDKTAKTAFGTKDSTTIQ
ncbi:prepilin-type N-terminal cleavage/methylation domain-containing protein [Lysinibacillus endophyticus]|uniref:type II secretion system protein n=1 Tax=Ureibacillus endophyticus TaxID=1978490 RepID=UPI003136E341